MMSTEFFHSANKVSLKRSFTRHNLRLEIRTAVMVFLINSGHDLSGKGNLGSSFINATNMKKLKICLAQLSRGSLVLFNLSFDFGQKSDLKNTRSLGDRISRSALTTLLAGWSSVVLPWIRRKDSNLCHKDPMVLSVLFWDGMGTCTIPYRPLDSANYALRREVIFPLTPMSKDARLRRLPAASGKTPWSSLQKRFYKVPSPAFSVHVSALDAHLWRQVLSW